MLLLKQQHFQEASTFFASAVSHTPHTLSLTHSMTLSLSLFLAHSISLTIYMYIYIYIYISHTLSSPQSRIRLPVAGPRFVLALTGIRRRMVQTKAIEQHDLIRKVRAVPDFVEAVNSLSFWLFRFRAKGEQLERFEGLSPESQDHILVLTVIRVPS